VAASGNTGTLKLIRVLSGASPSKSIRVALVRATVRQVSASKGLKVTERLDCATTRASRSNT
jgi:hypothetical protein